MRAKSSEPMRGQRGFTLVELIAILLMVGVLAVVAMPKLDGALALRNDTARDEVLSALRYASATAQSHRRLVCVDVGTTAVTLRIASARPASTCDSTLAGPDGGSNYTSNAGGASFAVSPSGTLYFQPDGRVTSDGAGSAASARTVTISGASSISVGGEGGYVR